MHHDHFDGDFRSDLHELLSRRTLLLGGTALLLVGCGDGPGGATEANVIGKAADGSTCIKLPQETNGPFPADGTNRLSGATVNVLDKVGVIREDLRLSFDGLSDVADGVPLMLALKVINVTNACAPLAGHLVYLWQCDAAGQYSIYERASANYLRGAAITDASGLARFTTIFPGCYAGRWPHLHFEVFASKDTAASGSQSLLTSQFAMDKTTCETIYGAYPAYAASPANLAKLSLDTDGIFASNTKEQLAAQTLTPNGDAATGLTAAATIGIVTA